MTEDEYDKHFGKGNDAVDCTIWSLTEESDFTKEEVEEYEKAVDKVESDIVEICRGLTYGRRRRKK